MNLRIWIFASVVPLLLTNRPLHSEETSPASPPSPPSPPKSASSTKEKAREKARQAGEKAQQAGKAIGNWFGNQWNHRAVDAKNAWWHSQLLVKQFKWPANPPVHTASESCAFAHARYIPYWKKKVRITFGVMKMFLPVQDDVDELQLLCAENKTLHDLIHYKDQLDKLLAEPCDSGTKGKAKVSGTVKDCVDACISSEEASTEKYDTEVNKADQEAARIRTIRCKHVGNYLKKLSEATKPYTDFFSSKLPVIKTLLAVVKSGKYVDPDKLNQIHELQLTSIERELQSQLEGAVKKTRTDATGLVGTLVANLTDKKDVTDDWDE